jgi:DNA-directed RNA polymerase specialized sigma24 family protein
MRNRQNGVSKLARGTSGGANPECWVDHHGDYLYRYALVPVPHPEVAENLLQKTLCAVVRAYWKIVRAKLALWNLKKEA